MNFLCDQCKQKYHVADEKVRGKAVTRFKCKKCGHVIELRMAGASDFPPAASNTVEDLTAARELPPSVPPPAPVASAPTRAGFGPLPGRPAPRPMTSSALPAAARLPTSPSPAALKAPPPAPAVASPRPAAAPLPTRSPVLAPKPAPAPAPSARAATSNALPTVGAMGAKAPAPATARAATGIGLPAASAAVARPTAFGNSTASSPLRSGLAGRSEGSSPGANVSGPPRAMSSASMLLNASETGWYAGVRDVPVGPLTRSELATRIESGDITHDSLVWREGLDDWRPLRSVDELADLVRTAARKMSDGLLGTMGVRRNDSGSAKIVPMQTRSTGAGSVRPRAEAHELEQDDDAPAMTDDEPTRMTALADLVAKAEQAGLMTDKPGAAVVPTGTPAVRPQQAKAPSVRPAAPPPPASSMPHATSPAPSTASSSAPVATSSAQPAARSAAPAVMTAPIPLVAPAAAPVVAAPVVAPFVAPIVTATPAVAPTPAANAAASETTQHLIGLPATRSEAPPSRDRKLGGLPIGAWVMMVGVLVAGVAIGLALRPPSAPPQGAQPATTQASTTIAAGPIAPLVHPVAAEIPMPTADLHAAAEPPPAAPAAAETAAAPHPTNRVPGVGAAPHVASAAAPAPVHLSAAQRAALAQLDAEGSGPQAPIGNTLSNPSAASSGPTGLGGQARAGSIITRFQASPVVHDCWQRALRSNPAHPVERLTVTLDVNGIGRVTHVAVDGTADSDLVGCIRQRAGGQMFGPGEALAAGASFNLAPGG